MPPNSFRGQRKCRLIQVSFFIKFRRLNEKLASVQHLIHRSQFNRAACFFQDLVGSVEDDPTVSARIQISKSIKVGKKPPGTSGSVCSASRGPLPESQGRHGRTPVSTQRNRSPLYPHGPPSAAETSYHSGITDACITFVAASWHVQLVLNTSPSRQIRERLSRQIVRVMACHGLNEEMAHPSRSRTTLKQENKKTQPSVPDLVAVRLCLPSSVEMPDMHASQRCCIQ